MGVCHNLKYVTTFREVKIVVCNNRPRSIHIFPANYSLPQNIVYGFHSYIVSDMRQKKERFKRLLYLQPAFDIGESLNDVINIC